MTLALSPAQLDQLIDLVTQGNVLPIVHDDLLAIDTPSGPRPLSQVLVERLATSLEIALPPHGTLSDVAAAFLATGPKAKMQRVRAELGAIIKNDAAEWVPIQTLRDLASIGAFRFFLTTGLDPLLGIALRAARGAEPSIGAFTSDAKLKDLLTSWRSAPAMVYHLFGTATNPGTNFAVTEEETIEGLLALKEYGPNLPELMGELRKSHLLLLGCRYPDWLARLFLRIARGKRLGAARDETELMAGADAHAVPLVHFLERFSKETEILPISAAALVADLAAAWRINSPGVTDTTEVIPTQSIFISYASADAHAARALSDALRRRGLDVWLDKGTSSDSLKPGDAYDRRIREQIARCELFVPVLSRLAQDARRNTSAASGHWPSSVTKVSPRTCRFSRRSAWTTSTTARRAFLSRCVTRSGSKCLMVRRMRMSCRTSCRLCERFAHVGQGGWRDRATRHCYDRRVAAGSGASVAGPRPVSGVGEQDLSWARPRDR